jgi:hypothetical protein
MSSLRITIAAAAVATVAIIVLPATAAVADEQPLEVVATTFLPNPNYVDMAMSPFSGQLFVSGGRDSTTITVLNLDGAILGSVADQAGASGLVLSPDGVTLYAALTDVGAISVIDVATRTERSRYQVGAGTCPYDLAITGGRLWFSYGCVGQDLGRIGSVTLATPGAPVLLDQAGLWSFAPRLDGAASGQLLFVVVEGEFPNVLASFDVSGPQPVRRTTLEQLQSVTEFKVSPDGSRIIVTTPGEYQFTQKVAAYATADLSEIIRYGAAGAVNSVAYTFDGRVATASSDWALSMFVANEQAPRWSVYRTFVPGQEPARRGLLAAPDGRLYLISTFAGTALTVIDPTPVGTAFSFADIPFPVLVRKAVTLHGTLSTSDGSAIGIRTVHVTRQDTRGLVTLPDVTTTADGSFTFTDRPRVVGETTWTFSYDGTARQLPSTNTVTVPVFKTDPNA